jgi:uncharacterized membrane protein
VSNQQTRPATAEDARPEPLLGIFIPGAPGLPKGGLFLVGVPRSACTPLPAGVVEVEGELLSERRVA